MKALCVLAVIATAALFAVGCGGDDGDDSESESTTTASTPAVPQEADTASSDPAIAELRDRLRGAGYKVGPDETGSITAIGALAGELPSGASVKIYFYASAADAQKVGAGLQKLENNPQREAAQEVAIEGTTVYVGTKCCLRDNARIDEAEFAELVAAGEGG